jgi:hypothetical protein
VAANALSFVMIVASFPVVVSMTLHSWLEDILAGIGIAVLTVFRQRQITDVGFRTLRLRNAAVPASSARVTVSEAPHWRFLTLRLAVTPHN